MPTIRAANSLLRQARRWGREWSLSARERHPALLHQSLRTNHIITRVVLRAALFVVRILERSAALLAFGHRPHDDHKNSAFTSSNQTDCLELRRTET